MVIFNQLRISDDGKRMYINLKVDEASYFNNVYLDSITIMTADKISELDPKAPTEDYIYKKTYGNTDKSDILVLTTDDFIKTWETEANARLFKSSDMSKTLFFVYAKVKGTPDACTPCGLDEEVTLEIVFDENVLYNRVMSYTKELIKDCNVPVGFTDFILLWNAFKSAIRTGHFITAIKFFNMLFDTTNYKLIEKKGCGCHG